MTPSKTWTVPGPGAVSYPSEPWEPSTTANTPAECCVTQAELEEMRSGVTVVIQAGAAYPSPLPPVFETIEFRGTLDPSSQFTLNGDYVYKWVELPAEQQGLPAGPPGETGPVGPAGPAGPQGVPGGSPVGVINVKDYGVVSGVLTGTALTTNTTKIQAVLDAIVPGNTVLFPPGEYYHVNLTVNNKTNFAISGVSATLVSSTTTVAYLRLNSCTDFSIVGLTSKSSIPIESQIRQNAPTRAFSMNSCARYVISGCTGRDCEGVGIYNEGSTRGRITGNYLYNTKADGIHMVGGCKQMAVLGNVLEETGDDCIAVVSYRVSGAIGLCEDVTISGNMMYRSTSRGVTIAGGKTITVTGNTVDTTRAAGIWAAQEQPYNTFGVSDVTISGNTVRNANTYAPIQANYAGIAVLGGDTTYKAEGFTITGNTVDGSAWNGILIGSAAAGTYGVVCSNNNVRNSGLNGILVQTARDVVLQGNFTDTSVASGIWASSTVGVVSIMNNVVRDPCTDPQYTIGINLPLVGISRGLVSGNVVNDNIGNATIPMSVSGIINALVFGNVLNGNLTGVPTASTEPFVGPRNTLLGGSFPTSGLGGGVGVIGVRDATTVPSTNPASGLILYSQSGAPVVRTTAGSVRRFAGDKRTVTANYTVLAADSVIFANGTAVTITLPAAATATGEVYVANIHATAPVTVASAGGLVNGATTMTIAANISAIFESTGTNWVALTSSGRTANEFNVKDYGAKGDGSTNDTAAINAAITALTAGGSLIFPPGRYMSAGGHTIPVPCRIIGPNGRAQPYNTQAQLRLINGSNADLLIIAAPQVTIRDLTLSGNYTNQTGVSRGLVINSGSNYFLLDSIWVESFNGDGIVFGTTTSTISGTMTKSESRSNQGYGLRVTDGSTDLIISDCYIDQNLQSGVFSGSADLSMTSCHIWGNGTNTSGDVDGITFQSASGSRIVNCYIESQVNGAGIRYKSGTLRGHLVQGCDIWENGFQGIYAFSLTDSIITGNIIRRNNYKGQVGAGGAGVYLDTCSRVVTTGNNFFNGTGTNRQTYGYYENNSVVNCVFSGNISMASQHATGNWIMGTSASPTLPASPALHNVG